MDSDLHTYQFQYEKVSLLFSLNQRVNPQSDLMEVVRLFFSFSFNQPIEVLTITFLPIFTAIVSNGLRS